MIKFIMSGIIGGVIAIITMVLATNIKKHKDNKWKKSYDWKESYDKILARLIFWVAKK